MDQCFLYFLNNFENKPINWRQRTRDYVYVTDVAKAFIKISMSKD